jgi:hypothetical protein
VRDIGRGSSDSIVRCNYARDDLVELFVAELPPRDTRAVMDKLLAKLASRQRVSRIERCR